MSLTPQPLLGDIAYDPVTDTLYGVGGTLWSIDPRSGVASFEASILDSVGNSLGFSGAAFDACGTLFGLEFAFGAATSTGLFTIDTSSGLATSVGSIANPGLTGSIAFAPDGTLVGSALGIGTLFDIDPGSAAVSNARGGAFIAQGLGFATDSPGTCGGRDLIKMTGGGQVDLDGEKNHSHSFGFNMMPTEAGLDINLEYNDNHIGKASGKKGAPTPLQIEIVSLALTSVGIADLSGTTIGLDITADCTVRALEPDNETTDNVCRVRVVDNGEPGTGNANKGIPADEFVLEVIGGPHTGYSSLGTTISKGNIQAHNK